MSEDLSTRLSRWSQRKLAARHGDVIDEPPGKEAKPPVREQEAKTTDVAPVQDEEAKPELPPIEELTAESDYTVFFGKNVPETLKNAALRKLWRSNPIFAHLDGLDDYCEDFNLIDTPITLAQTSYKVGRGFLDEIEEKIAKLAPADAGASADDTPADSAAESGEAATEMRQTALSDNDAAGDDQGPAAPQPKADASDNSGSGQAEDKGNSA